MSATEITPDKLKNGLRLRDSYDVPSEIALGPHSHAFSDFLWNWFGDTGRVTHGELDLTFLRDLIPAELELARGLIRRNLGLRQNHIIEGAAALHDVSAVPALREMLAQEPDLSRQLTIAGSLWRIAKDPVFPDLLYRAKGAGMLAVYPHLLQVLWLGDERALELLIELLPERDPHATLAWKLLRGLANAPLPFFRPIFSPIFTSWADAQAGSCFALSLLNQLESGDRTINRRSPLWHGPADYRGRRAEPAFREQMITAIRKSDAESRNGWPAERS